MSNSDQQPHRAGLFLPAAEQTPDGVRRLTVFRTSPTSPRSPPYTSPPSGLTVQIWPSEKKTLPQFSQDDAQCKHYASAQVDGEATHANWFQAAVPVGGGLLGAGLGAAIGGGQGALIGGAGGALATAGLSGVTSVSAQFGIKQRCDLAYSQCVVRVGNIVPSQLVRRR